MILFATDGVIMRHVSHNGQYTIDVFVLRTGAALDVAEYPAEYPWMDDIDESLRTLQAGYDKLHGAVTQVQVDMAGVKVNVDFIMRHYATKADVELLRSDLYKALEAQTWRLVTWMTVVCSGLTAAVYYIARNVH
jgi:hypothetical protein